MELKNIRIKSYRTVDSERLLDLSKGLTIVGPNSTGKTNLLKAIQLLFTGYENKFNYQREHDLTFGNSRSRTSLVALFDGDPEGEDKEVYELLDDLHKILGSSRNGETSIPLNLQFSANSNPSYQIFPNAKKPESGTKQVQFSSKQRQLVTELLSKFVCYYIPSEKGIKELYSDLLLPSLRGLAASKINTYMEEIRGVLNSTAEHLNNVLSEAGIPEVKASFRIPNDSVVDFISGFDFRLQDPEETSIFRKGMGIQSTVIMASFLWITQEDISRGKSVIWLLEEPESYLHPNLSFNCEKILRNLQEISLVVTTTHSLSFIPQDPNVVIGTELGDDGRTQVNIFNTYFDATKKLRESLGVKFSDYFNLSTLNVFLEGPSDRDYFEWILAAIEPQNDKYETQWKYLRSSSTMFLDFGGVRFISGFLRASYEFISKERVVVSVFDGDAAAEKERSDLQSYFGNKNIPFQPNLHYVSVRDRFAIEGLFPDDWLIQANKDHPSWFETFSIDAQNQVEPFKLKSNRKVQFSNYMKKMVEQQSDYSWANRWIQVCTAIDKALERLSKKLETGL